MAYSDYGGYVYKNGVRAPERSDAVLTPNGVESTPGIWPGFVLKEGRNGGAFHVLLGSGSVMVGLRKQSSVAVVRSGVNECPYEFFDSLIGEKYPDLNIWELEGVTVMFEIGKHKLDVHWWEGDNYYVTARLTEPDGTVWTGWSGYGVGAGLEDAGYRFSTKEVEAYAQAHWAER